MDEKRTDDKRAAEFERWLHRVDVHIYKRLGLTRDDLPDYCYADSFDAGETPATVARAAIRAAGGGID